ncbi:MAG: hypothetical protein WC925_03730 [Bacilli bacterium]|jgi:hypothetical protein
MKRELKLLIGVLPILTSLILLDKQASTTQVQASDPIWVEQAIAPSGEDYNYTISYNPTTILAVNPTFPTEADGEDVTPLNYMEIFSTNTYIDLTGGIRNDFMTMGTWAMIQGSHNLGRIYTITIDIDESKYTDIATELGGALGLQLREGRVNEFQNAEDENSGPTSVDLLTGVITWDLTIRDREHPFFYDESRLDDISNFNFISTRTIYLDGITITGTHFMEVTNGTSLRPVYVQYYGFGDINFNVNEDNRVDYASDDWMIEDLDDSTLAPLASMEIFTIISVYTYDDEHALAVTSMKTIVTDDPETVLIATPIETVLTMPCDSKNWMIGLSSLTYGGQDAMGIPESMFNLEYEFLGYDYVGIHLWNGSCYLDGYVTNESVIPATPQIGVNGSAILGNIMSAMVDGWLYTASDTIDAGIPENSYATFRLDTPTSYIALSEIYAGQGDVAYIDITLTIQGYESYSGSGLSNQFCLVLQDESGGMINETERYFNLTPADNEITVSYEHISFYAARSFSLSVVEIKDYLFSFSLSVDGFEYDQGVFSVEHQALFYSASFLYWTSDLMGATEDGVCEFIDPLNGWDMLGDEYNFLSNDAKSFLDINSTAINTEEIDFMNERYLYIRSTNPLMYDDFMLVAGFGGIAQQSLTTDNQSIIVIISALVFTLSSYMIIRTKQKRRI